MKSNRPREKVAKGVQGLVIDFTPIQHLYFSMEELKHFNPDASIQGRVKNCKENGRMLLGNMSTMGFPIISLRPQPEQQSTTVNDDSLRQAEADRKRRVASTP